MGFENLVPIMATGISITQNMYIHNNEMASPFLQTRQKWHDGLERSQWSTDDNLIARKNGAAPECMARDIKLSLLQIKIDKPGTDIVPTAVDETHDVFLPAMLGLHGHAFQLAISGLAEVRGLTNDSFSSWRSVTY